ncbi:MAG: metallophosphoesterase family protein [Chthoniobacter sp.]
MRFAIFGDIHANLEALKAVLADAEKHEVTNYVCLGDVVGYNANPHECLEIVRNLDCPVVKGNHDEQASISQELEGFNPLAEEAINWTRRQLTEEDKQWLRDLKMVRQVRDFTVVHATLDTPHKWGYVFNQLDAAASFNYQHTQICFYGHTHAPRAYIRDGSVKSQFLDKLTIEPAKSISSIAAVWASLATATGTRPTCFTRRASSSSNCAASSTISGPRRIKSSPPACPSGWPIAWPWENSFPPGDGPGGEGKDRASSLDPGFG